MKKLYMHTIGGIPAEYWPGEQICYLNARRGARRFANSLTQIRREQKKSKRWRFEKLGDRDEQNYGHVILRIP